MRISVRKQAQVLLMTAIYLFVVLTHIFFITKNTASTSRSHPIYNSIFKRKLENATAHSLNYLQRTYKSETPKPRDAEKLFTRMAACFILFFFIGNMVPLRQHFRIRNLSYLPSSTQLIFSVRI